MEASILFQEINSYESNKPAIAANGISRSKRRRLIKKKWRLKKEGKKIEPSQSVSSTSPPSSTPPSSTSPPCAMLSPVLPSDGEGEVFSFTGGWNWNISCGGIHGEEGKDSRPSVCPPTPAE